MLIFACFLLSIPAFSQEKSISEWVEGFNSPQKSETTLFEFKKIENQESVKAIYQQIRSKVVNPQSTDAIDLYMGQIAELNGQFSLAISLYLKISKPQPKLFKRISYLKGSLGLWSEISMVKIQDSDSLLLSLARETGLGEPWKNLETKINEFAIKNPNFIPDSFFLWVWMRTAKDESRMVQVIKAHYPNTLEALLFSNSSVHLLTGPEIIISR